MGHNLCQCIKKTRDTIFISLCTKVVEGHRTLQGLVKLNNEVTRSYFTSTNRRNKAEFFALMLKLNHLEELSDEQHFRAKHKHTSLTCNMVGHNKIIRYICIVDNIICSLNSNCQLVHKEITLLHSVTYYHS